MGNPPISPLLHPSGRVLIPAELLGFCAVEMEKEPERKRSEIGMGDKGKTRMTGFEKIWAELALMVVGTHMAGWGIRVRKRRRKGRKLLRSMEMDCQSDHG